MFDSPVMKLGQNACQGNCWDAFDGSGERSWAILDLLFSVSGYNFVIYLWVNCYLFMG
jgi:hypothetical protein